MTVDTRRLALGSCPDSWGVWFADDPRQPPWQRFLDELAGVGYEWLELGPYGYLPTDPARLSDELDRRGLTVAGGAELEQLTHELEGVGGAAADAAHTLEEELKELGIGGSPGATA